MKEIKIRTLGKVILLFLANSIFIITIYGQSIEDKNDKKDVVRIQYTILDKDTKNFHSFFGSKSGEISFKLVELKNLDTKEAILGVEVNINTLEKELTSSSIAFGGIGKLWGVSSGATYRNIRNKGFVFLDSKDLEDITIFLNGIIGATGQVQNKFTIYRISIGKQFEFGMVYDIDSAETNKWGFTFSVNESTYQLNYQDGITMLRSLSKFYNYIKKNQSI